jgi:tellurium resistance protein TerZ
MAINLVKGQRITLKKDNGSSLSSFCVGVNWGMIDEKGFFGRLKRRVPVDLDLSVVTFSATREIIDIIYFGNLTANGIVHSGDDLVGDTGASDGLDNEVVRINISRLAPNVNQIVFFLNSYKKQDFSTIPFASIRLYEGTPTSVDRVVATYNIASDDKFKGYVSMVLGKLYKRNGDWKFSAIGMPTKDTELQETVRTIREKYI